MSRCRIQRFSLLLIFMLLGSSVLADSRVERSVAPGVSYLEIHKMSPNGKPLAIFVIKVDRKAPNISFRSMKGKDHVIGTEPVRTMEERLDTPEARVVASINGDFYWTDKTYLGQPVGLMIKNGELLTGSYPDRPVLGLGPSGQINLSNLGLSGSLQANGKSYPITVLNKPRSSGEKDVLALYTSSFAPTTKGNGNAVEVVLKGIAPQLPMKLGVSYTAQVSEIRKISDGSIPSDGIVLSAAGAAADFINQNCVQDGTVSFSMTTNPDWSSVVEATGAWPSLVHNGLVSVEQIEASLRNGRHPRTAVGWNDKSLLFVAVDGRQPSHSMGMSLEEMGKLMIDLGCREAVNMDGGGSTTMVVRGAVMNRPSDGVDRSVSNGWAVVSSAPVGAAASLHIWPETPSLLVGSQQTFQVTGQDAYGNPVVLDPAKIKWSVNAALGTIDASGAFTSGKTPRAGQVIASYDKISTATTVNIWKSPAFLSIVPGSLNLLPGEESQLFVRAFDRANRPVILDPSAVSWSVAGEGVAVDSRGHLVAGSTTGSFIVTATVGEITAHLQGNISLAKPVASQDSSNDSAPAAH